MAFYLNKTHRTPLLQLCTLRKPYTVLERVEPFEDLDEEEFHQHFRITKATAMVLLTEVNWSSMSAWLYARARMSMHELSKLSNFS